MTLSRFLLAGRLALASLSASAQALTFDKPEDAVAYRQQAFGLLETHFSNLTAMTLNRIPYDPLQARLDANAIRVLSRLPFHAFPAGTAAPLAGSRATDQSWTAAPRYADSARSLQQESDKIHGAVARGDLVQLRKTLNEAGAICRKCHDQFRAR